MNVQEYKNWRLETDSDNILWLYFDKHSESVNSISQEVLSELNQIIDAVSDDTNIKGLIIRSGKKKGFIAGADIKELSSFTETDDAISFIRFGQKLFDKIENLSIPTVALIEGFCMGGGTELALACRYRIAQSDNSTRIGLPEVKLGIHPGWGGTVRLPKLIGAPMAMDLILSGRSVTARSAKKMGLIDAAVPERQIVTAARYYVLNTPKKHCPTKLQALTNRAPIRNILANILRKKVSAKAKKKHYPAPFAVIDNWVRHGVSNHQEAMITEANSIGEILLTETPKNLIRVFNLSESMKGLAKPSSFKPKRVHVIGAGTMGGDIAAWCALRGMTVTLEDREAKYIAPAMKRAYRLFKKKLRLPRLVTPVMDRLIPDVSGKGAESADIIIEAIYENLEAKQALFKRLETQAKPDAILATNTSSIPIDDICATMSQPQRLVGVHFFNPVSKMPLVEIVKGKQTNDDTVNDATTFVVKIGRQPIQVKSSPGFLVNRVLMPYMMEAMMLLEEGISKNVIDKVATNFGMPMGPVELADTVGLDICLSVAENLSQHLGGDIPQKLSKMVADGNLGRKTGKGFYNYKNGKVVRDKNDTCKIDKKDVENRLMYRMLNESVACYREGVITDLDMLDGGMIFGTGFAPFRGGPINYARQLTTKTVQNELSDLAARYGKRFTPDTGWDSIK